MIAGNIGGNNMQNNTVKAFRQRLVRGGFTDIQIWNHFNGKFSVSCYSSDGDYIRKELTEVEMNAIPRIVWFD